MDDADGWIEWAGGDCPVPPGTVVEVEFTTMARWIGPAKDWCWKHEDDDMNIVAYRLSKDEGK